MTANSSDTPKVWTDPDDAPELTGEFFERADLYEGPQRVRRGRPRSAQPKILLAVRYDAEVIDGFRATGAGWQRRMNDVLRDWLRAQPVAPSGH